MESRYIRSKMIGTTKCKTCNIPLSSSKRLASIRFDTLWSTVGRAHRNVVNATFDISRMNVASDIVSSRARVALRIAVEKKPETQSMFTRRIAKYFPQSKLIKICNSRGKLLASPASQDATPAMLTDR